MVMTTVDNNPKVTICASVMQHIESVLDRLYKKTIRVVI